MKVTSVQELRGSSREVHCPNGGFVSTRLILALDGMGYAVTHTFVPKGEPQTWHYKNHLESCFCMSGRGLLTNLETGDKFTITPGALYALDKHDKHTFQALEDTVLICVFNPPLTGREVHGMDHSYEMPE